MNSKGSPGSTLLIARRSIGGDSSNGGSPNGPGFSSAPPPPPLPPPPQFPSSVPAGRSPTAAAPSALSINALETAMPIRRRPLSNDFGPSNEISCYEPPAAIQNAMMTKDKKPFTYTPGMGGKLDLSQIRSPRMARRVAKNANDEGIEAPSRSAPSLEPPVNLQSATPISYAAQPRLAVPVFPVAPNHNNNNNNNSRLSSNVQVKIAAPKLGQIISPTQSTWSPPSPPSPPSTPTTPITPITPSSAQIHLAKAPTPWLQNRKKFQQEELPEWAKRKQSSPSPPDRQQHDPRERIIPLRIEDRPSVFSSDNDARQCSQPAQQSISRHQQRWGNASPSSPIEAAVANDNRAIVRQAAGVVGIGSGPASPQSSSHIGQYQYQSETEPAPVQSRSFRVLQKITDTDLPIDRVDGQQSRKLRLTENDKLLMNKVKERVDGEGAYLHQEEDPRYRGAAIPSRAFRYLRNMTDSADPSVPVATLVTANRPTKNSPLSPGADEFRRSVPASEQQAPEPKKYTGSAIPSRSFRMLQAMTTSPETIVASSSIPRESSPPGAASSVEYLTAATERKPPPWWYLRENPTPVITGEQRLRDLFLTAAAEENAASRDDSDETSDDTDSDSYLAYSTGHLDKPIIDDEQRDIQSPQLRHIDNDVSVVFKISIRRSGNISVRSKSPSSSSENGSIDFWKEITMGDDDYLAKDAFNGKAAAGTAVTDLESEEQEDIRPIVETSTPAGIVIQITEAPPYHQHSRSFEEHEDDSPSDDDSGVTSDTSRLISEIDTDSEYGSGKMSTKSAAINRYKRTQTHSRLFRLLSNGAKIDDGGGGGGGGGGGDSVALRVSSNNLGFNAKNNNKSRIREFSVSTLREERAASLTSRKEYGRGHYDTIDATSNASPRLPNWNFRRSVSCPRIKSWTNLPRLPRAALSTGPEDSFSSNNNNRSAAEKLAHASFPREYGRC